MERKEARDKELLALGKEAALGKQKIREQLGISHGNVKGFCNPPELIAYEKEIEEKFLAIMEKYKD